jgi:ABC-type transport system involved in cytochrome bd biosynthesis fused ATPase/permease subunit
MSIQEWVIMIILMVTMPIVFLFIYLYMADGSITLESFYESLIHIFDLKDK